MKRLLIPLLVLVYIILPSRSGIAYFCTSGDARQIIIKQGGVPIQKGSYLTVNNQYDIYIGADSNNCANTGGLDWSVEMIDQNGSRKNIATGPLNFDSNAISQKLSWTPTTIGTYSVKIDNDNTPRDNLNVQSTSQIPPICQQQNVTQCSWYKDQASCNGNQCKIGSPPSPPGTSCFWSGGTCSGPMSFDELCKTEPANPVCSPSPTQTFSAPAGQTFKLKFSLPNPFGTNGPKSLPEIINLVATWLFTLSIPVAILMILYAGFLFLTAGEKPDNITKARQVLTYAIIGLAVVMIGKGFVSLIEDFFGVDAPTSTSGTINDNGQVIAGLCDTDRNECTNTAQSCTQDSDCVGTANRGSGQFCVPLGTSGPHCIPQLTCISNVCQAPGAQSNTYCGFEDDNGQIACVAQSKNVSQCGIYCPPGRSCGIVDESECGGSFN